MTKKLRVLALCGFTQNAYIYSKQVKFMFLPLKEIMIHVLDSWGLSGRLVKMSNSVRRRVILERVMDRNYSEDTSEL